MWRMLTDSITAHMQCAKKQLLRLMERYPVENVKRT